MARVRLIDELHIPELRVRGPQHSEAILPGLDVHVRPHLAVDHHGVGSLVVRPVGDVRRRVGAGVQRTRVGREVKLTVGEEGTRRKGEEDLELTLGQRRARGVERRAVGIPNHVPGADLAAVHAEAGHAEDVIVIEELRRALIVRHRVVVGREAGTAVLHVREPLVGRAVHLWQHHQPVGVRHAGDGELRVLISRREQIERRGRSGSSMACGFAQAIVGSTGKKYGC